MLLSGRHDHDGFEAKYVLNVSWPFLFQEHPKGERRNWNEVEKIPRDSARSVHSLFSANYNSIGSR